MNLETYSDLKNDELSAIGKFGLNSIALSQYNSLHDPKTLAMRSVIAKQAMDSLYVITNLDRKIIEICGKPASFRYARQGIRFLDKNQFSIFYPHSKLKTHPDGGIGFFLNSGQSANYVALYALNKALGPLQIDKLDKEIYFESNLIFPNQTPDNASTRCLWIDSSVSNIDDYNENTISKYQCVIFDTTCFYFDDVKLSQLIEICIKLGKITLLTRSHIKLDSMGVEFGQLGSIFILNADKAIGVSNPCQIDEDMDLEPLEAVIRFSASVLGAHAEPTSFYPFYWDENFFRLNSRRIRRIRNNCYSLNKLTEEINSKYELNLNIETFQHGLYLKIKNMLGSTENLPIAIGKASAISNSKISFSDSFGFDFISLSHFVSIYNSQKYVRIAPPDLLPSDFEKKMRPALEILLRALQK